MEFNLFYTLLVSTIIGGAGGCGLVYLSGIAADVMHKDKPIYVELNVKKSKQIS